MRVVECNSIELERSGPDSLVGMEQELKGEKVSIEHLARQQRLLNAAHLPSHGYFSQRRSDQVES